MMNRYFKLNSAHHTWFVVVMVCAVLSLTGLPECISFNENDDITAGCGRITDSYTGTDERELLIIMDAHCNYSAQKNIASILDAYSRVTSPAFIALEGAAGEISVDDLRSFPMKPVTETISDIFLQDGKINGVEYFCIVHGLHGTNGDDALRTFVVGMEDPELYKTNLSAYQQVGASARTARECIEYLAHRIAAFSDTLYTDEQTKYVALERSYQDGDIAFFEYLTRQIDLCAEEQIDLSAFKNIALFAQSRSVKYAIDTTALEAQRKRLERSIAQRQIDWDTTIGAQYQLGTIPPEKYYRIIHYNCGQFAIDMSAYPQVAQYFSYLDLADRIDHSALYTESNNLSYIIAERMFIDQTALTCYQWLKRLWRMSKLLNLDLAADEYETLQNDPWSFDKLRAFFAQYIDDQQSVQRIDTESVHITTALNGIHAFYAAALDRNRAMVDNLLADMDMELCTQAAVVVGGFHIDGICKLLREKNISYRVISPDMHHSGHDQQLYRSRLANERTSFEASLEASLNAIGTQRSDTLAIASLLAYDSLAPGDTAGAVRIELKSIMTVAGIRALDQSGLYQLEALKARIEAYLMKEWGTAHFPQLDSLRIYRGLKGDIVVELLINGTVYTFFEHLPVSTARRIDEEPGRMLAQFNLNGTTVSVLAGSYAYMDAQYFTGNRLIDLLEQGQVALDSLADTPDISADAASQLISRWQELGLIDTASRDNKEYIQFTGHAAELMPLVRGLRDNMMVTTDTLPQIPPALQEVFDQQDISELVIDQSTPVSVLLEFIHSISQQTNYEFVHAPPHGTMLFELATDQRVYYAKAVDGGLPGSGTRIELRIVNHKDRPFDEQTRNDKIADIYNDSDVIDQVLVRGQSSPQYVSLDTTGLQPKPAVPLTAMAEYHDAVTEKLFRFIGDPDTFPDRTKALVFDLDGTLSERIDGEFLPIDDEIIELIQSFIEQGIYVVIVSGQPYPEIEKRVVSRFTPEQRSKLYVYPSNGAEGIAFNEQGQPEEFYKQPLNIVLKQRPINDFVSELETLAAEYGITDYDKRVTDSQITFRLTDSTNEERITLFNAFRSHIAQLGLSLKVEIAGRFSIDIALSDKAYAVRDFIRYRVPLDPHDLLFFGDSYHGNDEPMAEAVSNGLHFHVGTILDDEQIPDSVTATDGNGPPTTKAIISQLRQLIDMLVRDRLDDVAAQRIMRHMAAYYDFHAQFSKETPADQMEDKLLWPIWFSTNEDQWEQPISQLAEGDFGETFVGVGTGGVSLSYIAAAQPEKAVVLDLNPWITQFFIPLRSALIMFAPTRVEFISVLSGRPVRIITRDGKKYYQTYPQLTGKEALEIPADASLDDIRTFFAEIPYVENYASNVLESLIGFFPPDKQANARLFWQRYSSGMHQQFKFRQMLRSLSEADARAGKPVTWLSTEDQYRTAKQFIEDGKLFGLEANWAGDEIARFGSMLAARGDSVSTIYLSNVHHKITAKQQPDGSVPWINYLSNIASLPRTENALILSDQTLSADPFDSVSAFNGSNYEKEYQDHIQQFIRPDDLAPRDDAATRELQSEQFASFIADVLNDLGRPDLAQFYQQADARVRVDLLEAYAHDVQQFWSGIKGQIRRSETLEGDNQVIATELSALLGYGLKDLDEHIGRFANPYEFFMEILRMPYAPGKQLALARTVTDMRARLVGMADMYRKEPDVVLIDSSVMTTPAGTENFAAGTVLQQFRDEHQQRHGRRVVFVAVDAASSGIVDAKNSLDSSLFLRGETADMFDQVLAVPVDINLPEDRRIYDDIVRLTGRAQLTAQARSVLTAQGVSSPTDAQLNQQVDTMLADLVKQKKIQYQISNRFGISPDIFSQRVSVLTMRDSFLHNFAQKIGAGSRFVVPAKSADVDVPLDDGIYLIDILRSIGDDQLPEGLEIVSVRTRLSLTDEQQELGLDAYLALFTTLYKIYTAMPDTAPTYATFLNKIENERDAGAFTAEQLELLLPKHLLRSIFNLQMDTPLNESSLIGFYIQAVQEQFVTREKKILATLAARQIKLLRLQGIVQAKQLDATPVTISAVMADPGMAGMDISDVASYLEVTIPPRPVQDSLGDAIRRQRALDTSA